ncbi:MAG: hypothetical protein RBT63_09260, partial [Bdellovibrionales bacterium]|nr:hypothetical protein [Bdellovibrionales bacterium]
MPSKKISSTFFNIAPLVMIGLLPFISGCKFLPGGSESFEKTNGRCTQIGSITTIHIRAASSDRSKPFPAHLAIALNSQMLPSDGLALDPDSPEIDVDECKTTNSPVSSFMQIGTDRTQAAISFRLDFKSEDFELYFPQGLHAPQNNTMNLRLYSRTNCLEPFTQFYEITDAE